MSLTLCGSATDALKKGIVKPFVSTCLLARMTRTFRSRSKEVPMGGLTEIEEKLRIAGAISYQQIKYYPVVVRGYQENFQVLSKFYILFDIDF